MTRSKPVALLLALAALACGSDEAARPPGSPGSPDPADIGPDPRAGLSRDARIETAQSLMEDVRLARHPGDGGGSASLIELRPVDPVSPMDPTEATRATGPEGIGDPVASVAAASRARVSIRYEVGPHGIAAGGVLFLQTSPFWEWQEAQTSAPQYPGYTTATTEAADVELQPETYGQGLVGFRVEGRALEPGETVELVYGAGPEGARVDRYAERESPLWLHVDADGDGVRSVVAASPRIATHAGPPAILVLRQPTTAQPGEEFELRVAVLDPVGNAGVAVAGQVEIDADAGLELPKLVALNASDSGTTSVRGIARTPGVHRIRARIVVADARAPGGQHELATTSDPIVVREGVPRVLWADLHGHSNLSDGTGTPEDFFRYARDVAGLDVAALTDHDHWGMRFLDSHPEMWQRIRSAVIEAHEPGRFVTLLGYEWTSWLYGHRHVLYFDDEGPVLSSIDADGRYETPAQLWQALRGRRALTFAHHSAGGPVSTNWDYPPDPELEPVTEIVSVHGSSEASDSPRPIYSPVAGNFVRDALGRGFRLGLIGSGDSHDGHPGLAQLSSPARNSGLAALFAPERTREAVLTAMRERRVYATNGPRIFLRTTLDGVHEMGSALEPTPPGTVHTLDVRVASPAPLDRVELIRGNEVVLRMDGEGRTEWSARLELSALGPGEFAYVRVVQQDDGAAWSSPFFGPPLPESPDD